MSLDSETVMMGTPAEDLLGMYLGSGHPVVALGSRPSEEVPGQLLRLRRHPEKADLVAAVWRLASAGHYARHGTTMKRNTMRGSRAEERTIRR